MRLDKLTVNRVVYEDDGYGGASESSTSSFTIFGKYNIKNNELKPLPSGHGFYKQLIIATFDTLLPNDTITVSNTLFSIVSARESKRLNIYRGIEQWLGFRLIQKGLRKR